MRKSKDSIIDGVCGGIAEHFDIDPIWVRLIFVLCNLLFIYVVLMYIMDDAKDEET